MITREKAIKLILIELDYAKSKHPLYPTDPVHAIAIMAEEAGEAQQAAHDLTYGGKHADKLFNEIIQTGAMAIRALINFHHFKPVRSNQVSDKDL